MELERRSIERGDFPQARRGYDPQEVGRHLAEVAAAVEELKRSQDSARQAGTAAGAAAEQVRSIVEAAENSAAAIESDAHAEADRTRAQAAEECAAELATVQEASAALRGRADAAESDLDALVDDLRGAIASAMSGMRARAEALESELEAMKGHVAAALQANTGAGDRSPEAGAEPADAETPRASDTAEVDTAEAPRPPAEADEAGPDPEPAATPAPAPVTATAGTGPEGARLVALNMALSGSPRDETARYLDANFDLADPDSVLDEAYARVGG